MKRRVVILLAYIGEPFHGLQYQHWKMPNTHKRRVGDETVDSFESKNMKEIENLELRKENDSDNHKDDLQYKKHDNCNEIQCLENNKPELSETSQYSEDVNETVKIKSEIEYQDDSNIRIGSEGGIKNDTSEIKSEIEHRNDSNRRIGAEEGKIKYPGKILPIAVTHPDETQKININKIHLKRENNIKLSTGKEEYNCSVSDQLVLKNRMLKITPEESISQSNHSFSAQKQVQYDETSENITPNRMSSHLHDDFLPTIERTLIQSLLHLNLLKLSNASPDRCHLRRACRTDKGVSAAFNIVSLCIEKNKDLDKFIRKYNKKLKCIPKWKSNTVNFDSKNKNIYVKQGTAPGSIPDLHAEISLENIHPDSENNHSNAKNDTLHNHNRKLKSVMVKPLSPSLHLSDQLTQFKNSPKHNKECNLSSPINENPDESQNILSNYTNRLSDFIHIYRVIDVPKAFNPKLFVSYRIYSYLLPKHVISPISIDLLQQIFNLFKGTHDFHNFTKRNSDRGTKRYIMGIEVVDDDEFFNIQIMGQAFMMHQIRKMVGLVVLILWYHQGKINDSDVCKTILSNKMSCKMSDLNTSLNILSIRKIFDKVFSTEIFNIPKAPPGYLFLRLCNLDLYNRKCSKNKKNTTKIEVDPDEIADMSHTIKNYLKKDKNLFEQWKECIRDHLSEYLPFLC